MNNPLAWQDWLQIFLHYMMLSLLSVGGAIASLPEMQRYLVTEHHWLSDAQFNASVSLAQAAPGPNILFVALMGWNIGLNYGSFWLGLTGVLITMAGILLPSTTLTYITARWVYQHQQLPSVRSFKQGMTPIVIGFLIATGWIMSHIELENIQASLNWPQALVTLLSALIVWRTRVHLLWLLAAGAVLGWFGWI